VQRGLRRLPVAGDALPIAALSGVSAVATVISPALLAHPLLLVALTPRVPFLVLASTQTPLPVFLVVACLRLCLVDIFWFRIGRRLGPTALDRLPRRLRRLASGAPRARRLTVSALVLVRPIGRHLAAAAAVGLRSELVLVLDLAGTLGFLVALHFGAAALLG